MLLNKMSKNKLTKINVRVDLKKLDLIGKKLGVDRSKTIRAALNCVDNVLHNFFGGEVGNIFRRKKKNEELDLYENP